MKTSIAYLVLAILVSACGQSMTPTGGGGTTGGGTTGSTSGVDGTLTRTILRCRVPADATTNDSARIHCGNGSELDYTIANYSNGDVDVYCGDGLYLWNSSDPEAANGQCGLGDVSIPVNGPSVATYTETGDSANPVKYHCDYSYQGYTASADFLIPASDCTTSN